MAENNKVNSVSFFNSRLTSIISISLVLFLLGLVFLIGLLGNKLSVYVKENISFSIVLKDNQKEADIKKMQKTLDALPYIKSTEYISKEQAAKELEEELGENPETFLGFNPLQASIEVKLHSEYANPDSLQHIEKKIAEDGYSPAAVLGEIKEQGLEFKTSICESTLYSYIDKGVFLTITNKNLLVKGQKKRPYNKIKRAKRPPAGTSIENRPKEIDDRAVVGDWEMDCVEGKKKTKKTLLVLTERKSRREIIRPMRDQTARSVVRVLDSLEREYGANFNKIFRTITVDNGSEFADCAGMEKSCRHKGNRTKIYYCHPYSSYERGSNENVNRMIRRWFPKGTDFRKVTAKAIQKVEDWINNYPREILGFRTAEAVFQEGVACLI